MARMDEYTRLVVEEFERAVREHEAYTVPWLNLDVAAYQAYREGRSQVLPTPYCHDPANRLMMENAAGLDVLLLAGGGGQQSAVFALLGARVTVLDLMEEQLQSDRVAAGHYGTTVRTIQGTMSDLSAFADGSFDRVYQPISTLYAPDLRPVYAEVRRVLRPSGLYYSDYAFPLLYMAQNQGWDGKGFALRITEPYQRGNIRETEDGRVTFSEGEPIGETHHLFSDIINGMIGAGLVIRGLWENPRPDVPLEQQMLPFDKPKQQARCLPFGISVVAQKMAL